MKPNTAKILKFGLNYGIITGIIGIIFTSILISLNMLYDQSLIKAFIGLIVLIAPIIFAISIFKKHNQNSLTVGQALGVGIVTALVAAVVSIVFTFILTNYIVTDYWDASAEYNRIELQQQFPSSTPEQINDKIASQRKLAWITYPFILLFNVAIGFITSFITGLVLKTKETFN